MGMLLRWFSLEPDWRECMKHVILTIFIIFHIYLGPRLMCIVKLKTLQTLEPSSHYMKTSLLFFRCPLVIFWAKVNLNEFEEKVREFKLKTKTAIEIHQDFKPHTQKLRMVNHSFDISRVILNVEYLHTVIFAGANKSRNRQFRNSIVKRNTCT